MYSSTNRRCKRGTLSSQQFVTVTCQLRRDGFRFRSTHMKNHFSKRKVSNRNPDWSGAEVTPPPPREVLICQQWSLVLASLLFVSHSCGLRCWCLCSFTAVCCRGDHISKIHIFTIHVILTKTNLVSLQQPNSTPQSSKPAPAEEFSARSITNSLHNCVAILYSVK